MSAKEVLIILVRAVFVLELKTVLSEQVKEKVYRCNFQETSLWKKGRLVVAKVAHKIFLCVMA